MLVVSIVAGLALFGFIDIAPAVVVMCAYAYKHGDEL